MSNKPYKPYHVKQLERIVLGWKLVHCREDKLVAFNVAGQVSIQKVGKLEMFVMREQESVTQKEALIYLAISIMYEAQDFGNFDEIDSTIELMKFHLSKGETK